MFARLSGATLFVCLLAAFAPWAISQELTGSIAGTVTDPSGGGIPGVAVEVSGTNLVRPQTTTTDGAGYYKFGSLPPGSYTVTASVAGFSSVKETGLNLLVGKTITRDLRLQ